MLRSTLIALFLVGVALAAPNTLNFDDALTDLIESKSLEELLDTQKAQCTVDRNRLEEMVQAAYTDVTFWTKIDNKELHLDHTATKEIGPGKFRFVFKKPDASACKWYHVSCHLTAAAFTDDDLDLSVEVALHTDASAQSAELLQECNDAICQMKSQLKAGKEVGFDVKKIGGSVLCPGDENEGLAEDTCSTFKINPITALISWTSHVSIKDNLRVPFLEDLASWVLKDSTELFEDMCSAYKTKTDSPTYPPTKRPSSTRRRRWRL